MEVTIAVDRLRIHAFHGVTAQEQQVGIDFEVSATLMLDIPADTLAADSLDGTVSYADIVELIRREMAHTHALIETAAYSIRRAMTEAWPHATGGSVTVAKLHPPIPGADLRSASVTIAWP